MTRKKTAAKRDADQRSLTPEQRELMDLKKVKLLTRSTSPNSRQCLRERASPQKLKRKLKPKPAPALTPDQVAAQVAARIAELSVPVPKASPSVKVKSVAELQSSKIARLTTKIAVTEVEIERLKKEQVKAQEAVQKSLEVQKAAALAILERRVALENAIQNSDGQDDHFHNARKELETSFSDAKEELADGRPEKVPITLNQDSLLSKSVAETGENVMEKITKLFEKMEKEAKLGTVSEGARMVLDALGKEPGDVGQDAVNGAILDALVKALSLEEEEKVRS